MLSTIDKKTVYIVEFDTMPEMPITGLIEGEKVYRFLTGWPWTLGTGLNRERITYAEALTDAIETGVITEPGKYGIHLVPGTRSYEIVAIIEPAE
jgi:hypothetical protein